MSILQQIKKLPQITLNDLLNQAKLRKISRNYLQLNRKEKQNIFQVKQPFYIDRSSRYKHFHCNKQGSCLACQYQRLKAFQIKQKKGFLTSQRKGNQKQQKFTRIKTQRESQQSSTSLISKIQRKLRRSQGLENLDANDDLITKNIILKIKYLDKSTKQAFQKFSKRSCDDPEIIKAIAQFIKEQHLFKKNMFEIKRIIKQSNIKSVLTNENFLRKLVEAQKKGSPSIKHTNTTVTPQVDLKFVVSQRQQNGSEPTSIKVIQIQSNKKSKLDLKKKNQKQKVVVFESQKDWEEQKYQTSKICSKFLISDQLQMNDQLKEILKKLARDKYKVFKGTMQSLDQLIKIQYQANPTVLQKILKRIKIATQWVKNYISPSDHQQDLKLYQIRKLVNNISNIPSKSRRKSGLLKNNQQGQSVHNSRFYQREQGHKIEDQQKQIKSINRQHRKSRMYSGKQKQQSVIESQPQNQERLEQKVLMNKQFELMQLNSESQANQQLLDEIRTQHLQVIEQMASKKKSDLKVSGKVSFLRHERNQQMEEYKFLFPAKDYIRTHNKIQSKKNILSNKKLKQNNQIIRKVEDVQVGQILQKNTDEINQLEIQRKKRMFLKIKSTQFLKQNHQLIQKVESQLRNINLSNYIINPTDCILTQKKKIRALRQLIRIKSLSQLMQSKIINLIFQYLKIYQQNYEILIQKFPRYNQVEQQTIINWAQLLNRKQVLNQLMFYNLNDEFTFGKADEDEINYLFCNNKGDKSWQISSKEIKKNPFADCKCKQADEIQIIQYPQSDLIQKDMSEVCLNQKLGITVKIAHLKHKKQQQKQNTINKQVNEERFLMTQNASNPQ